MLKIKGARDGKDIELPQGLDAIMIETTNGTIYIDIGEPIPDMVLMRAGFGPDGKTRRLILSPMTERMAVGVIKT